MGGAGSGVMRHDHFVAAKRQREDEALPCARCLERRTRPLCLLVVVPGAETGRDSCLISARSI